jgi:hypothetical protein
MRNKIEIKVYLPIKMVGELETRNKSRLRSKFIEESVRASLDGEAAFELKHIETKKIAQTLFARLHAENDFKMTPGLMMIQNIYLGLEE